MFKKILQSLSKSQSAKPTVKPSAPPASAPTSPVASGTAPIKPLAPLAQPAPAPAPAAKTPEQLCEIAPKMPKDQIQSRLKLLYRRYNRSASSLDPTVRSEADAMLDAIVRVREKHFGEI